MIRGSYCTIWASILGGRPMFATLSFFQIQLRTQGIRLLNPTSSKEAETLKMTLNNFCGSFGRAQGHSQAKLETLWQPKPIMVP